jgi:hypothetical protein
MHIYHFLPNHKYLKCLNYTHYLSAKTVKSDGLLQGTSYLNFVNAIKSPATRKGYNNAPKRYLNFLKRTNPDDLLLNQHYPKLIKSQLIDYIMSLRNEGLN